MSLIEASGRKLLMVFVDAYDVSWVMIRAAVGVGRDHLLLHIATGRSSKVQRVVLRRQSIGLHHTAILLIIVVVKRASLQAMRVLSLQELRAKQGLVHLPLVLARLVVRLGLLVVSCGVVLL